MRALKFFLLPAAVAALAGCSSFENLLGGDKIDYRSQATKTRPLEVPPDLSQLSRDSRFTPQAGGTVSASDLRSGATAAAAVVPTVAPQSIGSVRVVRQGNQRWLETSMTPEQAWPQIKSFWTERGFTLAFDNIESGVMETDWAENRAKLPQDIIRNTLGRVLESLYSTGERDKFRTRVERSAGGIEIYVSHRGLHEVYVSQQQDQTMWTNRPADPQLEGEMLSRLMVKLGAKEEVARAAVATATVQPVRARTLPGAAAALQVDEGFDRAWRRVGLALDRSGFTVEDRDRSGGTYFVRYVDPKFAGKEEPGFFSRIFSGGGGDKTSGTGGPQRYRIAVKADGEKSTVSVLNAQGVAESSEIGQRIVALLVDDLK